MLNNGGFVFYYLCHICWVYIGKSFVASCQNKSEVPYVIQQCNGTEFNSSEPNEEPTFFEKLDEALYKSLSNPQPGAADKLFSEIEMFRNCLQRVRRMYVEMEGEKIESLRNSVVRLYTSKGGPTFTRYPVHNSENKQKLLDVFKWTEEDIKRLNKLLEESENMWYTVRHIVI